ncbi:MAG: metallophosphoesterase, partial [Pseudomonadota bacterium]
MKLLAVGDLHLGRVPTALPEVLAERAREFGPETAWKRCVAAALEHQVEAVLLAGDVVESPRDFFVGYQSLKQGVAQLLEADIQLIGVAGNHDLDVLPRLADALPDVRLLGRNGHWQQHPLSEASILGWSFPRPQVSASPLAELPELDRSQPIIGLLHCDLDQPDSHYAPVSRRELMAAGVDAWLLGHIHKPSLASAEQPIGYLGSVSALRASETGARGPWLIELQDGALELEQLALAPLGYAEVELDVSELNQAQHLDTQVIDIGRQAVERWLAEHALPDALGLRIRLIGKTAISTQLQAEAESLAQRGQVWEEAACQLFVDHIRLDTRPAIDLTECARQPNAIGLLARDLLLLEGPDSETRRALIDQGRHALIQLDSVDAFRRLDDRLDAEGVALW